MKNPYSLIIMIIVGVITTGYFPGPVPDKSGQEHDTIRFASFNVSLHRREAGQLTKDLAKPNLSQPARVAEVIQRVRPDVILLNEFDFDADGKSIQLFQKNFLAKGQGGQKPIKYAHVYSAPVNTGVLSGIDMNRDGKVALPQDGFGFGDHPGQYGMVVLSRYPIDTDNVRTFQKFLWKDMPHALRPVDPQTKQPFYPTKDFDQIRLSSKSHWDIPIKIQDRVVHFICSHPTPPVFDGPEDRNGRRNHDEIRMITDYVSNKASYLYDDNGKTGGLASDQSFVIAGDLNADPFDGESTKHAVRQLTMNARINNSFIPSSKGAVQAAVESARKNLEHRGNAAHDTGDFNDRSAGNVRVDYCLPSIDLNIVDGGVFWPTKQDPAARLNRASDHHLVWIDIAIRR